MKSADFSATSPKTKLIPGQIELLKAILSHKPINLVLEGGGAKGILYTGILKQLEERDLLCGIRNVAGSSAGGIIAFALALGYTAKEIYELTATLDFVKLQDAKTTTKVLDATVKAASFVGGTGLVKLATNSSLPLAAGLQLASELNGSRLALGGGEATALLNDNYLWEGEELIKLAQKLLLDKGFNPEMTFLEHHELIKKARLLESKGEPLSDELKKALLFKDLFLTGTRIDEARPGSQTFGWKYTPHVKMFDGFRATAGFPFAYKPHPITIDGETHFYTDGGAINNYPMNIFDCSDLDFLSEDAMLIQVGEGGNGDFRERWINPCTLGCKVDSSLECASLLYANEAVKKLGNPPGFGDILKVLMYDSNAGVGTYYKYNTIQGLDLDLTTLNFDLAPLEKLAMICSGNATSLEYFAQRENGFPLIANEPIDANGKIFAALAQDLVTVSNKLKYLEEISIDTVLNSGTVIQEIDDMIAKIIHNLKDDHPLVAVDVGMAVLNQIAAMKWTSGTFSNDRSKAWLDMRNKIANTTNAIAKANIVGWQDPGWGTVTTPAMIGVAVGGALGVGLGVAFLPVTAPFAVLMTGLMIWQRRTSDPNLKLENPLIKEFKAALNNLDYPAATKLVAGNTETELSELMLKEVQAFKATFWRAWPPELLVLEELLRNPCATSTTPPSQ